jgi:exodeoxyribonuclease III
MNLEIVSCNVNGLRAAERHGFLRWINERTPTVVGLQEVRATQVQLGPELTAPSGYLGHFSCAERAGYSGVGLYVKSAATQTEPQFFVPSLDAVVLPGVGPSASHAFDNEGRLVCVRLGQLLIVSAYFPNGNGKERDNSRVPYKLEFYERVRALLQPELQAGTKILVMGDFNTAHRAVDLARPQQNLKTSGFLPEECAALDLWTDAGWVDTFRHFHPAPTAQDITQLVAEAKRAGLKKSDRQLHPGEGHYSWWSQRGGARANNVGWRIDYIFASPNLLPYLKAASIHAELRVSDHCPVSVLIDPSAV